MELKLDNHGIIIPKPENVLGMKFNNPEFLEMEDRSYYMYSNRTKRQYDHKRYIILTFDKNSVDKIIGSKLGDWQIGEERS